MSSHMIRWMLTAAVLLQVLGESLATETISIRFITYRNPTGKDSFGRNCDFANGCDHFFQICIDKYSGNSHNFSACPFGQYTTGEFPNSNTLTFDHDLHGVKNPILVEIPTREAGVLLKVRVWDDDSWNGRHDPVDFMYFKYEKEPASQDHTPESNRDSELILGERGTSLGVEFQTICTKNYYLVGDECPKYCKPRNNATGHYLCTSEGDIECRQGWIDPATNCTSANVSCLTKQCKNKGICVGGRFEFRCNCTLGFQGEDCSEDVNECAQGNGPMGICHEENTERCENEYGAYICHCKPGYYKDQCQFSQPDDPPSAAAATVTNGSNTPMIIGIVVAFFILILLIVLILALLLREKRKRRMKEQGTNAGMTTGTTGQQTGPMTANTGTGPMPQGVGTQANGYSSQYTSTNMDNMRNQASSQTYASNGGPHGSVKVMEVGLLNPPPYTANGNASHQFDNPAYGENEGQGGTGGTSPANHVYDVPSSLSKKYRN